MPQKSKSSKKIGQKNASSKSNFIGRDGSWRQSFHWGLADKPLDHSNRTHVDFFQKELGTGGNGLPEGRDQVKDLPKPRLSTTHLNALAKITGPENISVSDFDRVRHSYGKFYTELVEQRLAKPGRVCDAVVSPRDEEEVFAIIKYCEKSKIAITPYAGGSSVTAALRTPGGGISLDLVRHFHQIESFSRENGSVSAQAGVFGPALEEFLNKEGYTCGHFPQSFEFSTIGGWVAARGAGQASTGYGRMEDMVLGMTVVTSQGIHKFTEMPASAVGPDLKRIFIGSEGTMGIITRVTMKARRYNADNTRYVSFLFKDFESSVAAMREMMQSGIGFPHMFRISDGEETDVAFRMKGKDKGFIGKLLPILGYAAGERCLMFATVEGHKSYTKTVTKQMKKIARKFSALSTGSYPVKKWLEQRYSSAYVRDPLMDSGVRIDTLETSVRWDNLMRVWENTRAYIKSFENTACLVHISHAYETGANLYFVFAAPMADHPEKNELKEFTAFHKGILDAVTASGGTLSHHHGIGRLTADRMQKALGSETFKVLNGVKKVVDPKGIMNPGALGL